MEPKELTELIKLWPRMSSNERAEAMDIVMSKTSADKMKPGMYAKLKSLFEPEVIAEDMAEKYEVDPNLVKAVMKGESGSKGASAVAYRPSARTGKFARGHMQVLPGTAKNLAKELGIKDYDIHDPKFNIEVGTYYLSKAKKEFGGDVKRMLAAYQQGIGGHKRDGTSPTAKKYVASILRNYEPATPAMLKPGPGAEPEPGAAPDPGAPDNHWAENELSPPQAPVPAEQTYEDYGQQIGAPSESALAASPELAQINAPPQGPTPPTLEEQAEAKDAEDVYQEGLKADPFFIAASERDKLVMAYRSGDYSESEKKDLAREAQVRAKAAARMMQEERAKIPGHARMTNAFRFPKRGDLSNDPKYGRAEDARTILDDGMWAAVGSSPQAYTDPITGKVEPLNDVAEQIKKKRPKVWETARFDEHSNLLLTANGKTYGVSPMGTPEEGQALIQAVGIAIPVLAYTARKIVTKLIKGDPDALPSKSSFIKTLAKYEIGKKAANKIWRSITGNHSSRTEK